MRYLGIFLITIVVLVLAAVATACLVMAFIDPTNLMAWACSAIISIAAAITFLCWCGDNL